MTSPHIGNNKNKFLEEKICFYPCESTQYEQAAVTCTTDKKNDFVHMELVWIGNMQNVISPSMPARTCASCEHTHTHTLVFSIASVSACTHRVLTIRPDSHFHISLKKYSDRVVGRTQLLGLRLPIEKSQLTRKHRIFYFLFYSVINSLFVFVNLCSIFIPAFFFLTVRFGLVLLLTSKMCV